MRHSVSQIGPVVVLGATGATGRHVVSTALERGHRVIALVRRPGTFELNPFPNYFDSHNVFLGNPLLKPEYTDALELGYDGYIFQGTSELLDFDLK